MYSLKYIISKFVLECEARPVVAVVVVRIVVVSVGRRIVVVVVIATTINSVVGVVGLLTG